MGTRVPAAAPPLVPSPQRQGLSTALIIEALLRARGPYFPSEILSITEFIMN